MIVLKRELDIEDFYLYNLNTATGITRFNEILFYMRQQLYSEIPMALDRKFNGLGDENHEYDKYVIEYKKEPWDARRLYDEIHKYPYIDGMYLFNGHYFKPDYFEEMILSRNPFDLYLYVKTMEEYEKEEIEKRYKRSK